MPRKGKKRPDAFTLIFVPHDEKPSFSVRVPLWPFYVTAAVCFLGLAVGAYFLTDYTDTRSHLAQFRRAEQLDMVHAQELREAISAEQHKQVSLRATITAQEQRYLSAENERLAEAQVFNAEVARLNAQIAELEQFKQDIRRIVGLDKVTTAASATPQSSSAASTLISTPTPATAIGPLEPLPEQRVAANLSGRGATSSSAEEAIRAAVELQEQAAARQAELNDLKSEVALRVAKVEAQWSTPEQLSKELERFDASPRKWPVNGQIMARFGYDARRIALGAQPFHQGIDIAGAVGTSVRAPQDGVVTFTGWNGSFGLTLKIQHSQGWSTLYAHLSSIPVKVGERVKTGQVIAYIGMTGLTTGPHLHYEIQFNGTPVDPLQYLGK